MSWKARRKSPSSISRRPGITTVANANTKPAASEQNSVAMISAVCVVAIPKPFMLMWVGSIAALLAAVVLGLGPLAGVDRVLLLTAGIVYLGGVQLPTFTVNVPLNNQLKRLDVDALDPKERRSVREAFEPRWNRSNSIRTAFASLSVALMMILLIRL